MTPEQIRESLGLPADATDATVQAKIAELRATAEAAEPETPEATPETPAPTATAPETLEADETPAAPATPEPVGASAQVPEGMMLVDEEAWKQVTANATAGAQVAVNAAKQHKSDKLNAALKAGKFPPSRLTFYDEKWDVEKGDPNGIEALVDTLPANQALAVASVGVEPNVLQANNGDDPGYDRSWLAPSERSRIDAAAQGQVPTITTAGD